MRERERQKMREGGRERRILPVSSREHAFVNGIHISDQDRSQFVVFLSFFSFLFFSFFLSFFLSLQSL